VAHPQVSAALPALQAEVAREGLGPLSARRRLAALMLAEQYRYTGPQAEGATETRDEPVTRERIRAEVRRARATLDQVDTRRPVRRPRRAPASGGADWHRPPPRSGPLTAADRAFLVYQHDQERLAATERRQRMRRTVARVRRELASHHGSR
jgi:hypothetical protein